MLFIYGRTAPPTSTFHIYLPVPYEGTLVGSVERDSMPVGSFDHGYYSARERSWWKSATGKRGHRAGAKTVTLRTHRQGR